jgi:hypothetical protein
MSELAYHNETTLVVEQAGANAIPAQLNLANRPPTACRAYTRQYKTYPNNGLTFKDGSQIITPIDTSTPSCFLNPGGSCLQFEFVMTASTAVDSAYFVTTDAITDGTNDIIAAAGFVCSRHEQFYRLPSCGAMAALLGHADCDARVPCGRDP